MATHFRTKIDYKSALVKNNCALMFSPTSIFSGPDYPMVSFKFFPCRLLLPWQRILGQNWLQLGPRERQLLSVCTNFPIFGLSLSDGVIFSLPTPVAMATNFGTKLTITRLPQKIIARCFYLLLIFGPGLCNGVMSISPLKTPVVMATNRFKDKNWLQAHKSVKRWNVAARLYSVAMGQIPRSTERISSFFHSIWQSFAWSDFPM